MEPIYLQIWRSINPSVRVTHTGRVRSLDTSVSLCALVFAHFSSTSPLRLRLVLMWRKGKRYGDDSGTGYSVPPAKFAKADSDDGSGDIVVCELSKNRRVTVRNWQGKIVVDIREFYIKDGNELPGKKGISLPLDQWEVLRDHIEEINEAVMENA